MLRKLLHEKTWAKAFEMSGIPVRRRHKNHIRLRVDKDGSIETETEYSDSDDSEYETDTNQTCTSSSCTDEMYGDSKIPRQNALDQTSFRTDSTSSSTGSNYIRYYDHSCNIPLNDSHPLIKGDCMKSIFDSISSESLNKYDKIENEFAKEICNPLSRTKASPSLFVPKLNNFNCSTQNLSQITSYKMAYEDLVNIDDNTCMQNLGGVDDDFELTRRTFSNCNECPKEVQAKPWKSTEEEYSRVDCNDNDQNKCNSIISSDLVEELDPPKSPVLKNPNYIKGEPILDPPPMFRNKAEDLKIINMHPNSIPFRKHSINSDKKLRRSITKSLFEYTKMESGHATSHIDDMQRMSDRSEKNKSRKCDCCNRSVCHSPRSSDSGVVGSCNLASPELNMHEYPGVVSGGNDSDERKKSILSDDIKFSAIDISPETYNTNYCKKYRLSEMEAAKFEDQCRCTSPFGSTPRTSCETSLTSENVFVGMDSSRTSVTSTYLENAPVLSSQPMRKMQRTSIRANINQHLLVNNVKPPPPPPRICRQPSAHLEIPKNVRQPIINQGWSTINISERTKPSLHYHMRIYREKPEEGYESPRASRKDTLRNCDIFKDQSRESENGTRNRRTRSRSEDLTKLHKSLKDPQNGFMVYRSDLYAHWWMKAKLPITVVSDSGKDYYFVKNTVLCNCFDDIILSWFSFFLAIKV